MWIMEIERFQLSIHKRRCVSKTTTALKENTYLVWMWTPETYKCSRMFSHAWNYVLNIIKEIPGNVSLFVWFSFCPIQDCFTQIETSSWLAFTYTRYAWPFNTRSSLVCNTYCDTEHPFLMVIIEDAWHSHLLPCDEWSCHYLVCLTDLHLSRPEF